MEGKTHNNIFWKIKRQTLAEIIVLVINKLIVFFSSQPHTCTFHLQVNDFQYKKKQFFYLSLLLQHFPALRRRKKIQQKLEDPVWYEKENYQNLHFTSICSKQVKNATGQNCWRTVTHRKSVDAPLTLKIVHSPLLIRAIWQEILKMYFNNSSPYNTLKRLTAKATEINENTLNSHKLFANFLREPFCRWVQFSTFFSIYSNRSSSHNNRRFRPFWEEFLKLFIDKISNLWNY